MRVNIKESLIFLRRLIISNFDFTIGLLRIERLNIELAIEKDRLNKGLIPAENVHAHSNLLRHINSQETRYKELSRAIEFLRQDDGRSPELTLTKSP